MPTFFVAGHKLQPEKREPGSPLACDNCLQLFRDIESARSFECTKKDQKPCHMCGFKPVGNMKYAPRTMTANESGLCDVHEAYPYGVDVKDWKPNEG